MDKTAKQITAPITKRNLRKLARRYAQEEEVAEGNKIGTPSAQAWVRAVNGAMDTLGILGDFYTLVQEEKEANDD